MSKLSDEQVVLALMKREGLRDLIEIKQPLRSELRPRYLTSKDALSPVLAGLSKEEWIKLDPILSGEVWAVQHQSTKTLMTWFEAVLTLPPRTLAHAIASALGEPEVGKDAK